MVAGASLDVIELVDAGSATLVQAPVSARLPPAEEPVDEALGVMEKAPVQKPRKQAERKPEERPDSGKRVEIGKAGLEALGVLRP